MRLDGSIVRPRGFLKEDDLSNAVFPDNGGSNSVNYLGPINAGKSGMFFQESVK